MYTLFRAEHGDFLTVSYLNPGSKREAFELGLASAKSRCRPDPATDPEQTVSAYVGQQNREYH